VLSCGVGNNVREADADQALRRPAAARVSLGLDQPFAIRFGTWAFAALQGDLGNSLFSGQSVVSMIAQRIPPTQSLMILTLLISVSVAVPLGVVAAAGQLDRPRGVFLRRIGLFANNATSCSSGEQPTRLSRASG
jgi:ABC-type dipeptide/oligopeptide/nickel transport system permease component